MPIYADYDPENDVFICMLNGEVVSYWTIDEFAEMLIRMAEFFNKIQYRRYMVEQQCILEVDLTLADIKAYLEKKDERGTSDL